VVSLTFLYVCQLIFPFIEPFSSEQE